MPRPARLALTALTLAVLAACDRASAASESAAADTGPATIAVVSPTATDSSPDAALIARADIGRIAGAATAKVWLIVISDFQCPYCKVWHDETAPRIHRAYVETGKIRIAYLNLPISTHRNAWPAHEAAMCAAEQGKFWPVADALFATQGAWKSLGRPDAVTYFDSLTRALPLDHARQRACVERGALRPLIQADYDRSTRLGVGSTPTFYVGTRAIIGAQPYEAFQRALDAALAAPR